MVHSLYKNYEVHDFSFSAYIFKGNEAVLKSFQEEFNITYCVCSLQVGIFEIEFLDKCRESKCHWVFFCGISKKFTHNIIK